MTDATKRFLIAAPLEDVFRGELHDSGVQRCPNLTELVRIQPDAVQVASQCHAEAVRDVLGFGPKLEFRASRTENVRERPISMMGKHRNRKHLPPQKVAL
jgi:hypothetical protein